MFGWNNNGISIELEYPVQALSQDSANVLSGVICNGIVMTGRSSADVKIYKDYIDFGPCRGRKDGQVFFHYHVVGGRMIYKLEFYTLSRNGVLEYTFGSVSEPDDYAIYQYLRKYIH